jgi:hypothetical protein
MDKNIRETKEIKTPGGYKITLNTYITGREKREITNVFLDKIEMSVVGQTPSISGLKGDVTSLAENKTIEIMVKGIKDKDGIDIGATNMLDVILDLPSEDFDFIISELNDLTTGKKKEKSN